MAQVKTSRGGKRTLRKNHRFGSHLSIAGGMENALYEAQRLGFDVVQVFVKNQRQWAAAPLSDAQVAAWTAALPEAGFGPVVAHATYLVNLGSADPELWTKSRDAFALELDRCERLGIMGLVVHPGAAKAAPKEAAISNVARALNEILTARPNLRTTPLLETTAGQGSALGRTFNELAAIIAELDEPRRVGVCIDSCHVFAAGYDIRSDAGYAAMIAEIEATVGVDRVRCWHLNDSRGGLGSRLDRHEHLGDGKIGPGGFERILADSRWFDLPMILETPKETDAQGREWDAVNLERLRTWSAKVTK